MTLERKRARAIIEHRQWGIEDLVASAWHTAEAARTLGQVPLEETYRLANLAAVLGARSVAHLAASRLLASTGGR